MKIGIIGAGIAGMACGYYLKDVADVFLHEKNDYAGGHANTITVTPPEQHIAGTEGVAEPVHFDTGFMVFNHITYPLLVHLFNELSVPTCPTNMSFSVQFLPDNLEYSGSGLNGLFAQRKNIFSLRHLLMLYQIKRFNDQSVKILNKPAYSGYTLERYINENRFGADMLWRYLIPMSAAVWSSPMNEMLEFPAQSLVNFFYNHGFLGLHTQHQWYTISGGSRTYRDSIMSHFKEKFMPGDAVVSIKRMDGDKVVVRTRSGEQMEYDKVIIASHADEALALLDMPTEDEKRLLGKFRYQNNSAIVHTDESVMPKNKRAWSSWNFRVEKTGEEAQSSCTYWMNSLQKLPGAVNYFVTLNDTGIVDNNKVLKKINYAHPLFDMEAVKAQKELSSLNKNGRVYFCGSYFKYGFHEDALASAVRVCRTINPSLLGEVNKIRGQEDELGFI